jgi:tetratricopeptide (TPR) repeat protein
MDQRLLKQSESLDRQTKKAYVEYIEKADKAFQKERFGSARYNLSQADQLLPSELLKEKIRICEENSMRVEKAQELIRQGYLLQKQKKIHEALKYFLQSLEVWEMEHIRVLAENLRKKLPRSSLNKAYQAEAEQRYAEAIEMYHEAYKFLGDSEARDRLGICLVKQGRYDEAVKVLDASTSKCPEFQYYMGIALAKIGHYYKALKQWEMIQEAPAEFNLQKQQLIEIAARDLLKRAKQDAEFTSAYNEAMILMKHSPAPVLKDCVAHMRFSHLESLWSQEQFEPMLDFLLSLEDETDSHEYLPVFLAKVYYRLAELEEEYLPEAISFWLTITHNPRYLSIPQTKGRKGTSIEKRQLIEDLQKKLEELIHQYKTRDEDLPEEVSIHWETEEQAIMFLKKITKKDKIFAEEICTPAFAERFGKPSLILKRLRALKPIWETDEDFWITLDYKHPIF